MQVEGPHTEEEAARFRAALERNTTLVEVLRRAATMSLPGWYLAAGALTQSVWNYVTQQDPGNGIDDYDLVYFDNSDLSWEAEDAVIQEGARVFADLPTRVEIRNQARVHLWYPQKFGIPCPKHNSTEGAITSWFCGTALFGVRLLPTGDWKVFAPWGFTDILNLTVRPNSVSGTRAAYERKTQRWQAVWPELHVIPWPTVSSGAVDENRLFTVTGGSHRDTEENVDASYPAAVPSAFSGIRHTIIPGHVVAAIRVASQIAEREAPIDILICMPGKGDIRLAFAGVMSDTKDVIVPVPYAEMTKAHQSEFLAPLSGDKQDLQKY